MTEPNEPDPILGPIAYLPCIIATGTMMDHIQDMLVMVNGVDDDDVDAAEDDENYVCYM